MKPQQIFLGEEETSSLSFGLETIDARGLGVRGADSEMESFDHIILVVQESPGREDKGERENENEYVLNSYLFSYTKLSP